MAALLTFGSAQASSVSYYLDKSNDLADGTNYAKVTITENGADIDFSVEVLTAAFPTPLSNFGMQNFYFNYDNALTVSSSNLHDVDPSSWEVKEDKNAGGGFGKFEFEWKGSGSDRTELLTFSIVGVTGDTASSYAIGADWLGGGSDEFFAAKIAGYTDTDGSTSGKFAGSTLVPVPAAAWLFASALGWLGWRRSRS